MCFLVAGTALSLVNVRAQLGVPVKKIQDTNCDKPSHKIFIPPRRTRTSLCWTKEFMLADRGDIVRGTSEIFFRKVKFWKGDPPPVFVRIFCRHPPQFVRTIRGKHESEAMQNVDGINYLFIKKNGLYFVATTKVSPYLRRYTTFFFSDYLDSKSRDSLAVQCVTLPDIGATRALDEDL